MIDTILGRISRTTRRRSPQGRLRLGVGWRILGLGLALGAGLAGSAEAGEPVDYLRDVKPILAAHCVDCHGEEKPRGRLRLDTAEGALAGGILGETIVPGEPEESELLLSVLGEGATDPMPLNRPPLSEEEIEILRSWIAEGASAPAEEVASVPQSKHWAFRPPSRPDLPTVEAEDRVQNPIDRFILAPLERDGIAPSDEADKVSLIRRVCLDVTGLPPTPEQVAAFLDDDRPDAFERLVDSLLASPHYGERWGRLWLDAARYADSNGYSIDAPREIWPYRDWVINALNNDLPFDDFAVDQLAGDLRPDATLENRVATGFHRNTQINQEGGIDREEFRVMSVIDRVNTTSTVFMGLTVGCAQCHDHKYDPISQQEYYELFAFLNNVDEPTLPVASPEDVEKQEEIARRVADYLGGIETDPALLQEQKAWEGGLDMAGRQAQSQEVREAFDTVFKVRSTALNRPAFAAYIEQAETPSAKEHREALAQIQAELPKIASTMVVRERREPRETYLLVMGDYTRPGDRVEPAVPSILPPLEVEPDRAPNRLDLARWLVSPEHPLTARVTVNRLWQAYFGRGLVETDDDFGLQGTPPSHPDLLDWLATEFVEQAWSLKAMHRLILTSATYRQGSHLRSDLAEIDPENRRLARQSRLRLEAELIRDSALVVSGLFHAEIGGPSVFPPQPDGVMNLGQMRRQWKADTDANRYRRGMYTYFWRATPHPLLVGFDAPDASLACTRRVRSNTPLQALMLLNDQAFFEFAQALASRVLEEGPSEDAGRLDLAFQLCLARLPEPVERARLQELLDQQRARSPAGEAEHSAWTLVARVLLNLDEFITRE
ncbi:DUF1553 domain-containing protein [soil metagenome]